MAKKSLIAILLSCLLFSACRPVSSSYKRENVEAILKNICQKEFSINEIIVKEIKDTFWIYLPLKKFVVTKEKLDPEAKNKISHIFLALRRTILSMQNPPKFYVFAISDITYGYDYIEIGYVDDLRKLEMFYISRHQLLERTVRIIHWDENAKGDLQAAHLKMFDIDFPDFLSLLIAQKIRENLSQGRLASYYIFVSSQGKFNPDTKTIEIQYSAFKKNEAEKAPSSFQEALKIAYYFIVKAYDFNGFNYIEIKNNYSGKSRYLSRKAFWELRLD